MNPAGARDPRACSTTPCPEDSAGNLLGTAPACRRVLLARSFVLSLNARAAFAILIVGMSVAYAVVTGSAVSGLNTASERLDPNLVDPSFIHLRADLAPFPTELAPSDAVLVTHARRGNDTWGTIRPWPYDREIVPGLYAAKADHGASGLNITVGQARSTPYAPWDWTLLPPDVFEATFPELRGQASFVVTKGPVSIEGLKMVASPAGGTFYQRGAEQVYASVHAVVAAMGLTVAVLAAGVLRLEVLARERDLATLEAIGGSAVLKRLVILRAVALSFAGVALGTLTGIALTLAASRAIGTLAFRLSPGLVLEAVTIAFAAGLLAGVVAGLVQLRTPLARRLGRRGPSARRFPGPVRFLFVTPRLFPSVLIASLVLTGVSGAVIAAAQVPYELFQPDDGTIVIGQTAGNPLRGSASRYLGEHAMLLENVTGASPEILSPTVVNERPVMVRGVVPEQWGGVDSVEIVRGRWAALQGEATVGTHLARASGLGPGDSVLVPGAYRATVHVLTIVGVHQGAGFANDQIVTDLDTAASLADLPSGRVHMVRLRAAEDGLAGPDGQWLHALALSVEPSNPIPNTPAVAQVDMINLDERPATRTLNLRVNGLLTATVVARVPGETRTVVEIPFLVPESGKLLLEVNPSASVDTAPPSLRVEAPQRVALNQSFEVLVTAEDGTPVPGARVEAAGQSAQTTASGRAQVFASAEGALVVTASSGNLSGGRLVFVVDPARAFQPILRATTGVVTNTTEHNATHLRYEILVTLVNVGGSAYEGVVDVLVNGTSAGAAPVALGIEERRTIALDVLVPTSERQIEIAGLNLTLPRQNAPEPPPEQRVRTIEEVLRGKREALARGGGGKSLTAQAFVEDVFAGLEPSVAIVILATLLHAGAGVSIAVLREMREREEASAILRDLGATPDQIAFRAMRDALLSVLPGLVLGAALAWAALAMLSPYGWPAAFGHTLPLAIDVAFVARVVGGLAVVAALTAYWAAYAPRSEPPRQVARVPLRELLGGRL